MKQDLISAVIITHNRKNLVQKAIQSVLNQTCENIELIVVDDASDDGSKEILEALAADNNFRYIYISKNESKGGNHARNVGISASTGKYIAFLDDDDEWLPSKTEKQVNFLENHSDYGAVVCSRIIEYNYKKRKKMNITERTDRLQNNLKDNIWTKIAFITSELMIRREIFDKTGLFDEELKYWQEYEFSIRLAQITNIGLVPEHLILYRVIQKDKARLTNNLTGWEEAVNYVDSKHEFLLKNTSSDIQTKHKLMIFSEGLQRARNAGDIINFKKYRNELLKLNPSLKNIVKCLISSIKIIINK